MTLQILDHEPTHQLLVNHLCESILDSELLNMVLL